MFIEFQTKDDKAISYNVNNLVFVGEMKENVSVMFEDGTHVLFTDEYNDVVKKLLSLSKIVADSAMFIQFDTKKNERIAFPIRRVFYILEQDFNTAIMFNDGTRIEVTDEYSTVMKRINSRLDVGVIRPNNIEETKS